MSKAPPEVARRVSRGTAERLALYHDLLLRWTRRINLIAPSTRDGIWLRHIDDALQLWEHAPEEPGSWIDLGSGGGLPGVVVAVVAAEHQPGWTMTLVESDRRKAAFLQHCVAELALTATVVPKRVEEVRLPGQDVISARALAPLPRLLELAVPLMHRGSRLLFPKGRTALSELTEAERYWHIDVEVVPSRVEREGVILKIFGVEPRT